MPIDITPLKAFIGRTESVSDELAPYQAAALAATLDIDGAPGAGDALPPLWHWVYFHRPAKTRDLPRNGNHPQGAFIPHVPLPRRMFAGGRLTFNHPLTIGQPARRTATIVNFDSKQGDSGELIFARVRNELRDAKGVAVIDEQDIVYRAGPGAGAAEPPVRRAPRRAVWQIEFAANEMLLFRYSALIFNAHRIHWDRPYTVDEEGYPALVVHGQLIATLLAELVRRNTVRPLRAFHFRSLRALYEHTRCRLCGLPDGDVVDLWAEDDQGALVMDARAELARQTDMALG